MTQPAPQPEYIITEELAELIEGQLTNKWCKSCPYEGGGINSGIKAHLRSRPHTSTPLPEGKEGWDYYTPDHVLNIILKDRKKQKAANRNATLSKLLEDVCKQCPVKGEHMPLEDKCAESCDGCLVQSVVIQSLRTQEPHP